LQIETRPRERGGGEGERERERERERESWRPSRRVGRQEKNAEGQSSAPDRLITYKLDSCRRREACACVSTCRRIAWGPRAVRQIYIMTPRSAFFAKRNNTSLSLFLPSSVPRAAGCNGRFFVSFTKACTSIHAPAHTSSCARYHATRTGLQQSLAYIVAVNAARGGINIAFGTIWRHGGLLKCKLHYHSPAVITFFSPSPAFSRPRILVVVSRRARAFSAVALARSHFDGKKGWNE